MREILQGFLFASDSVRRLHFNEQLPDSGFHQHGFQKKILPTIFSDEKALWYKGKRPRDGQVSSLIF